MIFLTFLFSYGHLKSEQSRIGLSKNQLAQFFSYQYRNIAEEILSRRLESINIRIEKIAKDFGVTHYNAYIADEHGKCLASSSSIESFSEMCNMPEAFTITEEDFSSIRSPAAYLIFDEAINKYLYSAPLFVGKTKYGYIYVAIDDPYEFYRGNPVFLALKIFLPIGLATLIVWSLWGVISRKYFLKPYFQQLLKLEKNQALTRLSTQVAHDIRSPLTALDISSKYLAILPEEQRLMIRNAAERIKDIANNLLNQHKGKHSEKENNELTIDLLSTIISEIVSEKRLLFQDKPITINTDIHQAAYLAFVKLQPTEFKRILSNLINNAEQAMAHKKGEILIRLSTSESMVNVAIEDNGKGIPQNILPKLFEPGFSFDKPNGLGLGLSHAKQHISTWQGNISIKSDVEKGTTLFISLPRAKQPKWFADSIKIFPNTRVVILDDDKSIHQIWQHKINDKQHSYYDIKINAFYSIKAFSEWFKKTNGKENIIYLIDYELFPYKASGLDVIEKLHLNQNAILVTSHFEDEAIRNRCEALKITIIPKNIAEYIAIEWHEANHPDLIIIDDSEDITDAWQFQGKMKNKNVMPFNSGKAFLAVADTYRKNIPIYIDHHLKDEQKGEMYAKAFYDMGFSDIYLATGYDKTQFRSMPWIKDIVDKTPPF